MKVVVAPDSFGGRLSAREAAAAIARGWAEVRPDDEVATVPMSDGGEGLLDVVHAGTDTAFVAEVCGPLGHPIEAWLSLRPDGTAIVESALACGLALIDEEQRDPMRATTYGVGELVEFAVQAGATRVLVGLGGSATVDGGAGAITGLGFRVTVADGSGLRIGGRDLDRVAAIGPGWHDAALADVEVVALADVRDVLGQAAAVYGPQKGAGPSDVEHLARALMAWADIVEGTHHRPGLRDEPGTGAAGGLGFGLAGVLGARIEPGAEVVADLVGLDEALEGAALVITGEGRLDATSMRGKVVGTVVDHAANLDPAVPVVALVGDGPDAVHGLARVLRAPAATDEDAAALLQDAAAALAREDLWPTGE